MDPPLEVHLAIIIFILFGLIAQDSTNVRMVSWWPYSRSRAVASIGDYTYLGAGFGFYVLNTVNPISPLLVDKVPLEGKVNRLFISNNYLYCANGKQGLRIFDVTDFTNPVAVGSLKVSKESQDIFVIDSFAYLTTSDPTQSLCIINISSPTDPVLRGIYSTPWGCYGVNVCDSIAFIATNLLKILNVSDPSVPILIDSIPNINGFYRDVEIRDTILYSTEIGAPNYLGIANVSDPTNPIVCSNTPSPQTLTKNALKDTFCFLAHSQFFRILNVKDPYNPLPVGEINEAGLDVSIMDTIAYLASFDGLKSINIVNPQNPTMINKFALPGIIYNIDVHESICYLAMQWNGLWLIDISNLYNPEEVGKWVFITHDAAVKNKLAFCACGDSGLRIIDVSNPQSLIPIGDLATPFSALGIAVVDSFCYIAEGYGGLRIVSISDSTNPTEICFFLTSNAQDVAATSGVAFVADSDSGLKIIDVSTPNLPSLLGGLLFPDYSVTRVVASGDTIYVVSNSITSFTGSFRIVDVSTPTLPEELGSYFTPYHIKDLSVHGNLVYIIYNELSSDEQSFLSVIDISNPANPVEVGYYLLPSNAYSCVSFNNYILTGTADAGMMIFEYYGTAVRELESNTLGGQLEIIFQNPISNNLSFTYFVLRNGQVSFKIYDVSGRLCYFDKENKKVKAWYNKKIELSNFSSGVYFICLESKWEKCIKKFLLIR